MPTEKQIQETIRELTSDNQYLSTRLEAVQGNLDTLTHEHKQLQQQCALKDLQIADLSRKLKSANDQTNAWADAAMHAEQELKRLRAKLQEVGHDPQAR